MDVDAEAENQHEQMEIINDVSIYCKKVNNRPMLF